MPLSFGTKHFNFMCYIVELNFQHLHVQFMSSPDQNPVLRHVLLVLPLGL